MSGPYFQDVEAGDELPSVVKEPTREPPQWATMSISRNPSGGRSHPS